MPVFAEARLREIAQAIVRRMGSAPAEAGIVADHLVRANLAGHDSHGVGMLPAYVEMLGKGLLVPNQTLQTVLDFGALLVFEAARGFGQRMAAEAVDQAIARARQTGACVLALRNSAHIGRVGTYGEQAAAANMAFLSFTNVTDHADIAAPYGSAEARLGTNPVVIAVPGPEGPLLLDMATTTIAAGKARVAHNKGEPVPPGSLIDAAGNPTTDPAAFIEARAGALQTFGLHKGSGIAVMCELLAGAVAGGKRAGDPAEGGIVNSMFGVVVDLARLDTEGRVASSVAGALAHLRSARRAPGFSEILLPGEPERQAVAARGAAGIPVDDRSWQQIRDAGLALGLPAEALD
ncbi:MAG: malate/lactate/ureidoglycolate dehydrogenase [Rhodospirillales bacterium 20-64-7]|nr:MAG: malate/lactate/ureidoglycolate dehydrogenase [Rhodospirillales bacterium 20-64-7]